MKLRKSILPVAALACLATAPSIAFAGTFNVLVGYADNLRASGFFPSTWLGDAGVVSESSAAQSFDSGAVRIDNTSGAALQITNFVVHMGFGVIYNIWGTLNIAAGQTGIFTQTVSYNFDSSDNAYGSPLGGINGSAPGSNGIGGCSSTQAVQILAGIKSECDARQTIVTFDANGVSHSFADTGHILDTGLYDFINGSPDGNESINWNAIGSGADRGGTVPLPASLPLLLTGVAGLGMLKRRKNKSV